MLKRLFKRNSPKVESTINAFAAAYGVLKTKWLKEQAAAQGLTREEQIQVTQRQNDELRRLISNFGLDEEQILRRFPVPTLTDNDLNLELRPYEKDLDEAFRKEIGRVVPYLTSSSITGLEHYIRRIDVAMLSIAKNEARKDILNILAAPYLPALISADNYLIRSYYDRCMMEISSEERPSLTAILNEIVNIMTLDGHRARLGASIRPPKQGTLPIGNYIRKFEDYVLRVDGIRMDSIEMLENEPLNNERRRAFVSGLSDTLRTIVTQPEYHATWHSFTNAYTAGFSRLYPTRPLFIKSIISKQQTKVNNPRITNNSNRTNFNNRRYPNTNNNNNNNKRSFTNTNNKKPNNYTPTFLSNKSSKTFTKPGHRPPPVPSHSQTKRFSATKPPARSFNLAKKINNVESQLDKHSSLLSDLASKLSLFDVPKATLTLVAILAFITPTFSWQCTETPPFFPTIYHQSKYSLTSFDVVTISDMTELCKDTKFRPAYLLGEILIDNTFLLPIETRVTPYDTSTCDPAFVYQNATTSTLFLLRRGPITLNDLDFDFLLNVYAYHYSFNFSCPTSSEVETTLPIGKFVPSSPVNKKRKLVSHHHDTTLELASDSDDSINAHKPSSQCNTRLQQLEQTIQLNSIEKQSMESGFDNMRKQYENSLLSITSLNERINALNSDLTNINIEKSTLASRITIKDRQIADLTNELTEVNDQINTLKLQNTGAQNTAIDLTQQHNTELENLRKTHTTEIQKLKTSHKNKLDAALASAKLKYEAQRNSDFNTWQAEKDKFLASCITEKDNAIATMKKIFDEQLEKFKTALVANDNIKSETMEVDEPDNLASKLEDQTREIISLRQLLELKQTSVTTHGNTISNSDLCTAYNNFVTFIDHIKRLDIYDALLTIPNSVASLLTFLTTLVGSRLVAKVRTKPKSYTKSHTRLYDNKLSNPQPASLPSKWKFGDGPLLESVNSILHEALPRIIISLDNLPILTLLDTGASINVLDDKLLQKLPSNKITHIDKSDATATSANGSNIKLTGKITLQIKIEMHTYFIECYTSPEIGHDLILGKPGLSAFGDFTISWTSNKAVLGKHSLKLHNTFPIVVDDDITLNPLSHNILNPLVQQAPHLNDSNVFTIVDPRFKGINLLSTYSQITPVKTNRINFIINNYGCNPVTLVKDTSLGYVALVEHISDNEIRITNDGYDSDEADIIDRLPPYPHSSTKTNLTKREFLTLAQIDDSRLTTDDIYRLHEIIWTYKTCFYEYSGTSGLYTGPEHLELITIPHNVPKPIRTPRYTPEKEREIEKQINDMLTNDMIEPSRTPYLSRINLVKKKDNNWRFVVDFRAINKLLQPQSHHIPRIDSILDKASGKQFYTSLDLKNGFHQLLLDKSSRYLTGFPTHMGIFQYKRIPMGLVGSPDFFNYVMETVFGDSNNFVYLDDILLTDNTIHDHMSNIERALIKAKQFGLCFSLAKCLFFRHTLEYLGFLISSEGVQPNPLKTQALTEKDIPKNEKELRSFLGAANYYRKHIPNYSKLASLLYDTINNFLWTSKHTDAFTKIKEAIAKACTLAPPDSDKPYTILTDASIQGLGAALLQDDRPIAFASRTLKRSEVMYAPVQLEALGLVYALKQFTPYIYGKRTTVLTDQNSLISLMTKKDVSNILDRYKNFIMGFDLDIKYIKGENNHIADYLSRQIFHIDLTKVHAKFEDVFPTVTNYLQFPFKITNFINYLDDKEKSLYPDSKITSRGKTRVYVPHKLRFMVLTLWHEHPLLGNHSGYDKGAQKFKDTFHWPAVDNDIRRVWTSCQTCLQNKPHGPLQAIINNKTIPTPAHAWHTISIDHLVVNENSYVLVIIDDFSKFVNLHHVNNMGALTTTKKLSTTFFLLGFPYIIKSDNGPAFVSDTFKSFCATYQIQHYLTSPYNHEGNAIVERYNRTIREAIRIYNNRDILEIIHSIQYAHNFSYTTTQEGKPKEYILSTVDKFINEPYVHNELSGRRNLLQYVKSKIHSSHTTPSDKTFITIPNGTIVYKKNNIAHKNETQFLGPYKIVEHLYGDTYHIIKITKSNRQTGTPEKCNARFLKIAPQIIQNNTQLFENKTIPSTTDDSSQTHETIPKRGRGRPKKYQPLTTTSTTPMNITTTNPTKRGRGRPRKIHK